MQKEITALAPPTMKVALSLPLFLSISLPRSLPLSLSIYLCIYLSLSHLPLFSLAAAEHLAAQVVVLLHELTSKQLSELNEHLSHLSLSFYLSLSLISLFPSLPQRLGTL
mmetsp:Transcript_36940/g.98163  ORF Transcript_36940/g.98163 Transcript_36940/m.98163 type:complete len:110 (-) Transcript_36940:6-335(-)